jgi:hypothetical protein
MFTGWMPGATGTPAGRFTTGTGLDAEPAVTLGRRNPDRVRRGLGKLAAGAGLPVTP